MGEIQKHGSKWIVSIPMNYRGEIHVSFDSEEEAQKYVRKSKRKYTKSVIFGWLIVLLLPASCIAENFL